MTTTSQHLDPRFVWEYRVIASAVGGAHVGSERVPADQPGLLAAAHDRLMALPGARMAETVGPFAIREVSHV